MSRSVIHLPCLKDARCIFAKIPLQVLAMDTISLKVKEGYWIINRKTLSPRPRDSISSTLHEAEGSRENEQNANQAHVGQLSSPKKSHKVNLEGPQTFG